MGPQTAAPEYDNLSQTVNADPERCRLEAETKKVSAEFDRTPKPVTATEWKKLKAQYFTVRHPKVESCGHKLDLSADPKSNCSYCWFAFFQNHGEMVQTVDSMFTTYGPQSIVQIRGKKFLKNFLRFMATLNAMKQQAEAANAVTGEAPATESGE